MRLWIQFYSIKNARSLLRPVVIASVMMSGVPAFAGPLDTAYANAMVPYVVLKRGTVECGKPAGEHLAYKARLLNILGRIPNIDLVAADREIESAFEREAPRPGYSECSETLLDLYKIMSGKSAEMALQHLSETVRDH